jgi:hypothetical protein
MAVAWYSRACRDVSSAIGRSQLHCMRQWQSETNLRQVDNHKLALQLHQHASLKSEQLVPPLHVELGTGGQR